MRRETKTNGQQPIRKEIQVGRLTDLKKKNKNTIKEIGNLIY